MGKPLDNIGLSKKKTGFCTYGYSVSDQCIICALCLTKYLQVSFSMLLKMNAYIMDMSFAWLL